MAVTLRKGSKVSLTKEFPNLKEIMVGLGWDTNQFNTGYKFDLDASVFLLKANGKVRSEDDFIFYNNPCNENKSVVYGGDNRDGEGDGDDETIDISLDIIPSSVHKIVFTITIYDADKRKQKFGMVSNSYFRVVDKNTGAELIRYDLGEEFTEETAVVTAELYRHENEWRVGAVGAGFNNGLEGLCHEYGIEVE